MRTLQLAVAIVAVLVGACVEEANGGLVFDFSGLPGDPTIGYSISGSHNAVGYFSASFYQFRSSDDPFQFGGMGGVFEAPITGTGTLTNETSGASSPITRFRIGDFTPLGYPDKSDFFTESSIVAYPGDLFTASGVGTFTMASGYTFDNLVAGTYTLEGTGNFGGTHTLNIRQIPEPSSLAVFGLPLGIGLVGIAVGAARRRGERQSAAV